jgi:hypothetical protein
MREFSYLVTLPIAKRHTADRKQVKIIVRSSVTSPIVRIVI